MQTELLIPQAHKAPKRIDVWTVASIINWALVVLGALLSQVFTGKAMAICAGIQAFVILVVVDHNFTRQTFRLGNRAMREQFHLANLSADIYLQEFYLRSLINRPLIVALWAPAALLFFCPHILLTGGAYGSLTPIPSLWMGTTLAIFIATTVLWMLIGSYLFLIRLCRLGNENRSPGPYTRAFPYLVLPIAMNGVFVSCAILTYLSGFFLDWTRAGSIFRIPNILIVLLLCGYFASLIVKDRAATRLFQFES